MTVNLWLSPDHCNLDPSSGGLLVYDRLPPEDWSFEQANRDTPRIHDWLGPNASFTRVGEGGGGRRRGTLAG